MFQRSNLSDELNYCDIVNQSKLFTWSQETFIMTSFHIKVT